MHPTLVEELQGKDVRQIAAGGSHSLAFNSYFKGLPRCFAMPLDVIFILRVERYMFMYVCVND
jgi:hypothetical protein